MRAPVNPCTRLRQFWLQQALPGAMLAVSRAPDLRRVCLAQLGRGAAIVEPAMSDLNKVMLIGRLGGQPEIKVGSSGKSVCKLRLATSHNYNKDGKFEKETTWHSVVVFDKLAEICAEYLTAGRLVYIEGVLRNTEWTDKDGVKHQGRDIRASEVHFLSAPQGSRPQAQAQAMAA